MLDELRDDFGDAPVEIRESSIRDSECPRLIGYETWIGDYVSCCDMGIFHTPPQCFIALFVVCCC